MMLRSKIMAAGLGTAIAFTGIAQAGAAPLAAVSTKAVATATHDGSLLEVRNGRKGAFAAGAAVAGVGILAGAAIANSNRYGYAEPSYYAPPPVYYEPQYYEAPPVYVAPRRYYSVPAYGYYYDYPQTSPRQFNYR